MIKFFRHIRQRLIGENRFSKYLLYAFGEIILVVIGILIALQINNWNEDKKQQAESQYKLEELREEFTENRVVLKQRIKDLERANNHVRKIVDITNRVEPDHKNYDFDSIISHSLKYGNYNPANSTIQELISSGKLDLITNNQLKKSMYTWLQMLEDSDEDFKNQDHQAQSLLIPYLYKNISMQNLNAYNNMEIKQKSRLYNNSYNQVIKDLEFENLYQGKLFWNSIMIAHYKSLDSLANDIVRQTQNLIDF
tara:strand:+ start:25762 stop:26517 length:756 start_codon:yes stop_codon:yes gene_type:complete